VKRIYFRITNSKHNCVHFNPASCLTNIPIIVLFLHLLAFTPANAQNNLAASDYDASHVESDSVRIPLYKLVSFHTNLVDWTLTTPNLSLELDLDTRKRSRVSLLLNGKYNPQTWHSFNPKWVYNLTSVRGEIRKYWRTGNVESAVYPEYVERDTTLGFLPRNLSYYRRKYVGGHYNKHPRSWRAYYLGLYATYGEYNIFIKGYGSKGKYASVGLSYGWDIPLYQHYNGSGWDLEYGLSAGPTFYTRTKYDYISDTGKFVDVSSQGRTFLPVMLHDVHVSLVYRFRSIDKKVRYGGDRFARREIRRLDNIEERLRKMRERKERMDSIAWEQSVESALASAKAQLATYTDTTSISYVLLKTELERVEHDIRESKTDTDGEFVREVLGDELSHYQQRAQDLDPDYQSKQTTVKKRKKSIFNIFRKRKKKSSDAPLDPDVPNLEQ